MTITTSVLVGIVIILFNILFYRCGKYDERKDWNELITSGRIPKPTDPEIEWKPEDYEN